MGEPTFEEDFVHKEGVPNDDGDIDEIEMQNDCLPVADNDSSDENEATDSSNQFVRQLSALKNAPTTLEARPWPETVSMQNAEQAINDFEREKPRGTAVEKLQFGYELNVIILSTSDDDWSTTASTWPNLFETNPTVTRVELLESIERALSEINPVAHHPTDGTETEKLDTFSLQSKNIRVIGPSMRNSTWRLF